MAHTKKVAITIPDVLIKRIDTLSKKKGLSRSRYITLAVAEKVDDENKRFITEAYDMVFSDKKIQKKQLETAKCFDGIGSEGGQEW